MAKTAETSGKETSGKETPGNSGQESENPGKQTTDNLLKHPKLWRANQLGQQRQHEQQGICTGFKTLNQHLPGQGWPKAALVEVMLASAGVGELRLFVPALRYLSQQSRWLAWVAPPFIPYAPALHALGIDISKILVIHPRNHQDALWAVERACKSGSCSSVFAWLDERKLKYRDTQRLQIAAKQGNTLSCLFRPHSAGQSRSSLAELRLLIHELERGMLRLSINKRRGGWPIDNLTLPVAQVVDGATLTHTEIEQQLQLWRLAQPRPPQRVHTREPLPLLAREVENPAERVSAQPLPLH